MAEILQAPILKQAIPAQTINEGSAFGPFNLKEFVESPAPESGEVQFLVRSAKGGLPEGLICTTDGIISGTPAKGTRGKYNLMVVAENKSEIPFSVEFELTIRAAPGEKTEAAATEWLPELKTRVWEALGKDLPAPQLSQLANHPLTVVEIYYLAERFATLTIWDAYNFEPPSDKKLLTLPDSSPHYAIYDRGSCLVGVPKDLFSHERTGNDLLKTAIAMAGEAYKRGWAIQLSGFDKMTRAAWIELQYLGEKHGKQLEILYYTPSESDLKIYSERLKSPKPMI